MKISAFLSLSLVASASAFAPSNSNGRPATSLDAKKTAEPAAKNIFDLNPFAPKKASLDAKKTAEPAANNILKLNLFAPKKDQNDFGASKKKTLTAEPKKIPIANRIFDLDLFAPKKDQNDYGARKKKTLVTGKITDKSYVPSGLSAAQYEKIRKDEVAKKAANYERNVKKAGKFQDFTDWYLERGTDLQDGWISATNGHTMVKTKYDWSGLSDKRLWASEPTAKKVNGKAKK